MRCLPDMDSPVTGLHGNARRHAVGDGALPGLVFAFRIESDGRARELPRDESTDVEAHNGGWLWLHFNLADNAPARELRRGPRYRRRRDPF